MPEKQYNYQLNSLAGVDDRDEALSNRVFIEPNSIHI
jgi:hypothetical protein